MTSRFDCWSRSYPERPIYAKDAAAAAEIYFRAYFDDMNLPEDSMVFVENDEGNVYEFNVITELVRLFKATKINFLRIKRQPRAVETTSGVAHIRPHDGRECIYLADTYCNKCGWFKPEDE